MPLGAAQQLLGGWIWNGSTAQVSTQTRAMTKPVLAAPASAAARASRVLALAGHRIWEAIPTSAPPMQSRVASPAASRVSDHRSRTKRRAFRPLLPTDSKQVQMRCDRIALLLNPLGA